MQPGTLLGPYSITGALGAGAMGEVYRAEDIKLTQTVALKFLPERLNTNAAALARFHREVRIARQVSHSNVCRVFDISEYQGHNFLTMEYVDGEDLASLLRRIGHLPGDKAIEITRQICAGLSAAHQIGVLHRDLKPANVLITTKGVVKLLDFGLARLVSVNADVTQTAEGTVLGTPAYMSPEQAEGKPLDVRSDIFSFGAVLYEMLSGQRAFGGTTTVQVLNAVRQETPPRLQTRPPLERIVRQCLVKQPDSRFQTIAEVRMALEQALREPGSAEKAEAPQPSIAVLPFTNMSADKEAEYFSDGITEEIISVLTAIAPMRVAARTSSFAYKGKDTDIKQIGRELDRSARSVGADWWTTCTRILMGLIRPALLACFAILFIHFLKEYSAAVFLFTPGSEVMGTTMLTFWIQGDTGPVAALAVLQIAITAIFIVVVRRVMGVKIYG